MCKLESGGNAGSAWSFLWLQTIYQIHLTWGNIKEVFVLIADVCSWDVVLCLKRIVKRIVAVCETTWKLFFSL